MLIAVAIIPAQLAKIKYSKPISLAFGRGQKDVLGGVVSMLCMFELIGA
jgi:hypothetical protein